MFTLGHNFAPANIHAGGLRYHGAGSIVSQLKKDGLMDAVDIQQLETIYQMGEDEKLDYNPIEKYLKCKELQRLGFTNKEISEFMSEKES